MRSPFYMANAYKTIWLQIINTSQTPGTMLTAVPLIYSELGCMQNFKCPHSRSRHSLWLPSGCRVGTLGQPKGQGKRTQAA